MKKSQHQRLLEYLEENGSVTIRDMVISPLYFNAPNAVIRDLKKSKEFIEKGYSIIDEWIGNHEYKKFTLVSQNISESGQVSLF
jgi:hypothetical protein